MKRYDSYKDSGVKWLGEIPSHWEMLALKHILKHKKEVVGKRSSQYDLLSLTLKGVIIRDMDNPEGKFPASFDTYQIVEPNDFIFCNFDNEETPRAVGLSQYKGMITGAYDVLYRNNPLLSDKYLIYYFLYIDDSKRFKPLYKGLRKTVPFDSFMSYKIPVPSRGEQDAVVEYLDAATSKIDEAIAQQQKMIDLLNERKQIIINNAVTKGLDPNVPMKDSCIDWIGNIPVHWKVCKFNNVICILTDYTANGSFGDLAKNVHYQSEGYARLVRLTDLRENLQNENGVWVDRHGYDYLSKSSLFGGELLMANVGAYSGLPCIMPIVDYPTSLAPNMFLIKQDESKITTNYLYYLLLSKSYFSWLQTIALSSAQPKLNKDNIRSLPILLPPKSEQERITNSIQQSLKPIEKAISISNNQISLLQERKQIIINDVVTGKVKVV